MFWCVHRDNLIENVCWVLLCDDGPAFPCRATRLLSLPPQHLFKMLYRLLACHHDLRARLAHRECDAVKADVIVREVCPTCLFIGGRSVYRCVSFSLIDDAILFCVVCATNPTSLRIGIICSLALVRAFDVFACMCMVMVMVMV